MTYNEQLANRVREFLITSEDNIVEKRMFGGLCFMVDDKMLVGVEAERMMVRVGPDVYEEALEREGCTPMDFTGKVMKGFVFVDASVLASNRELSWWINVALAYNRVAKSYKRAVKKAAPKKATGQSAVKKAASAKQVSAKASTGKAVSSKKAGKAVSSKKAAPSKKAAKKATPSKGIPTKKSAVKSPTKKAPAKKTTGKGRKR